MQEEPLPSVGKGPENHAVPERPPVAGSYDHASAPMQMKAQHIALIVYFGAYDWIAARERSRKAPMEATTATDEA